MHLRIRDLIALCLDHNPDDFIEIGLDDNESVRLTGITGEARGRHAGTVYLTTSRPLALATTTADRDCGCGCCVGGRIEAEHGAEVAVAMREGCPC